MLALHGRVSRGHSLTDLSSSRIKTKKKTNLKLLFCWWHVMSNDFPRRESSKEQFLELKLFPAAAFLWTTVEHFQLLRRWGAQPPADTTPELICWFHRGPQVIKSTLINSAGVFSSLVLSGDAAVAAIKWSVRFWGTGTFLRVVCMFSQWLGGFSAGSSVFLLQSKNVHRMYVSRTVVWLHPLTSGGGYSWAMRPRAQEEANIENG